MANVLYRATIGGLGKEEETKIVDLSMASGNQIIIPTEGKVLTQVTVNKPATLIDSNIKEGINIGGIIGTYAGGGGQPTLNAPSISRNGNTLTITNPSTNGNFITSYKLYSGTTLLKTINATGSTTYNLLQLGVGVYNLTARACGNNFNDSNDSNSVAYGIYTITNVLDNITNSNSITSIGIGQTYSGTLSASTGYYLPNTINITQDGETVDYSYNNVTGAYSVPNVNGTIVITASGSIYSRLESPVILLADTILSWSAINGATVYSIRASGVEVATTSLLNIDLSTIFTEDGIYGVTVIAQGVGYQESNPSNQVIYNVGVFVYGVTGLDTSVPQLTRTDNNVGNTYYINTSTGVITHDFDNIFPEVYVGDDLSEVTFNGTNWLDSNNLTYSGNVFRKFNKFYKQVVLTNGIRTGFKIALANSCPADYYCPAYFKDEQGNEMDFYLVGVYKAGQTSSKLISKSGVTPYGSSATNLCNYGKNNLATSQMQYFEKDWRGDALILDLFRIIFATKQTTDVWSTWRTYGSITGSCNSLRTQTQMGFDPTTKATLFLGLEDIVGNGYECIAGIWFNGTSIMYSNTPSTDTVSATGKATLSYVRPTSNNYIKTMGYDANEPDLEYPNAVGGTATTYYCDYEWYGGTVLHKGANSFDTHRGLWSCDGGSSASHSYANFCARLCAQPL